MEQRKNAPEIHRATVNDFEIIAHLGVATFTETFGSCNSDSDMRVYLDDAFSADRTKSELLTDGSAFYIAYADGRPAAYMKTNTGGAQTERGREDWLEIQRLYVLAAFKRRHIGSALMRTAFSEAQKIRAKGVWLGVWEHNYAAQEFYKSFGFVFVGSHDFVLGTDRQTDLIMECPFGKD